MLMLIKREELIRLLALGDMLRETVDYWDKLDSVDWETAAERLTLLLQEATPLLNDFVIQWGAVCEDARDQKLRIREFSDVKV